MKKYYVALMALIMLAACDNNNPGMLRVEPQEISCPDTGGEYMVALTSPNAWTAKTENAWVTVSPADGEGNSEVRVKISANKETAESTSKVVFTSGESIVELPVRRAAKAAPVLQVVSEKEINTPREGGSYTIRIESNIQWQVDKSAGWVTIDKGVGKNNGSVTMTIAAATTPDQTTATVTVSQYAGSGAETQTITITRGGTDATSLSVDQASIEVSADGGNYTIQVSADCKWRVSQDWDTENWISFSGTSEGEGNGSFGIKVEPATSTNDAIGVITIEEQREDYYPPVKAQVTIHRAGKAQASLSVDKTSITVGHLGGDYGFEITSNYSWKATTSSSEIASLSTPYGSGNATLVVTVHPTESNEEATAQIRIFTDFGGEQVTINIRRLGKTLPYFSVGVYKKVYFSRGNLQYKASTHSWRFAEHQYDYVGGDNKNISPYYTDWIDLFGWGTGDYPTCTNDEKYFEMLMFHDWGYNKIENGEGYFWRTLTADEWEYVLFKRNGFESTRLAVVNGVSGVILLPDQWEPSDGITFNGTGSSTNGEWSGVANVFTLADWQKMEAAGAVFLPAAGERTGYPDMQIIQVNGRGGYWSSTIAAVLKDGRTEYPAEMFTFSSSSLKVAHEERQCGHSVRLVRDK